MWMRRYAAEGGVQRQIVVEYSQLPELNGEYSVLHKEYEKTNTCS